MDIAGRTSSFCRFAGKLPSSFWQFVRKSSARVPLRYRLIVAELALVGIALAVISVTGINYLRSYLVQRENQQVESQADSLLLQTNVQSYLAAELAGGGRQQHESTQVAADWLASGKVYRAIYPVSGYSDIGVPEPVSGPSISVNASWLGTYQPVVVGAQAGSGRWDVISTPLVVIGPNGPIDGTLVVGIDITSTYSTLNRLAGTDILVSVILLLGLLVLGILIIRGSLRPLADIKQTADAVSAGDLAQRMPEAGSRTEFGSAGRSFNQMLGHLEAAVRARSRSERAARRSEQRTRNLLADLSHELRTPLTAIRGFAEYYRHRGGAHGSAWEPSHRPGRAGAGSGSGPRSGDGVPPSHNGSGPQVPPELERIIGRVEQEADRMAELLEDMLLLADLGQEGPFDSQPVDLLTLTEDAVREARLTAPNTTINLDSSDAWADPDAPPGSDGVLPVAGDKAQLRKIIGIMTRNALAQAPEGTAIDVRVATASRAEIQSALSAAEAEPDSWPGFLTITDPDESADVPAAAVLEVTDHGRSLTEEQSKYAFDRYCRVSTAGSGLDLTVVATVINAHGGAAWVRPQASRGTTYCIAVPLLRPAPDTDDDQAGAAAETEGLPAVNVVGRAGMTVSDLAGSAGSDGADGAGGAAVAGVRGEEQDGPTWVESGPPDEISFLATSSAGRAAQDHAAQDHAAQDHAAQDHAAQDHASGAQRRPSRAERGLPVPRPEQADVHEQRVQLVERDPSPPPVCQRRAAGVTGQHRVEVGRPEQPEHGQVGFPVTAVRGRVDEPAAPARPEHVA
jgi:two-component system, OmpR family, sensor kinase